MSYAGLCVGGPLAGMMRTSAIGKFTTPSIHMDNKPLHVADDMAQALRANDVEVVTYLWAGIGLGGHTFGLWVPDGMPLHEAINILAEGYVRSVN